MQQLASLQHICIWKAKHKGLLYRVIQEEIIFLDVTISVNVRKGLCMNTCLITKGLLDGAVWIYKHKKKNTVDGNIERRMTNLILF